MDDATIIDKSAYTEIEPYDHRLSNVINKTKRVTMPTTFGVLKPLRGPWN